MFRSVFRFSMRELFLLTLVVALAMGWFVDRSQIPKLRRDVDNYQSQNDRARKKLSVVCNDYKRLVNLANDVVAYDDDAERRLSVSKHDRIDALNELLFELPKHWRHSPP